MPLYVIRPEKVGLSRFFIFYYAHLLIIAGLKIHLYDNTAILHEVDGQRNYQGETGTDNIKII